MNIFSGLKEIVEKDFPLGKLTRYGCGGNVDYLIRPASVAQLGDVVKRCDENDIEMRVIGFGSNLLISDEGVPGAVIKLQAGEFTKPLFDDSGVTAPAGADLNELVFESVRRGLGGIEVLAGIPGSVGGAVKMNAGGSFGDIAASVESVKLMDKEGNIFETSKPELVFDYRFVNITAKFILAARMELVEADPEQLLKTTKEIWIYKKNTQPLNIKNAGCVFKNPRGLSAGALIDRTGLKGLQIGAATVSDKHANFITTEKDCKSSDVKRLIDAVAQRVQEKFDVELKTEIEIW